MQTEDGAKRERLLWLATFVLAAIPLMGWWLYGLFDLDEGFYAAVTGEMLRTGDWITPHYNGKPWFEKPILLYWTAAPCVALFGEAIGPRLPSVLANLGLYAMVGVFLARRYSPVTGRWAVLILGTSPLVALLGRMMMTDALFVFCFSWSALTLYRSFVGGWRWRALSGVGLGLAVLAKGPVAIVLWVGLLLLVAWRQRGIRRASWEWQGNLAAAATMLAAISLWYLPAYWANGDVFVQKFLIEQNFGRFVGGDKAHGVPWYLHAPYYVVVLGLGMAPWSWRILEGWPKKVEEGEPGSTLMQFCAHWLLVVLVFFTLSGSKLPHYIYPATVPLAVLCARRFSQPLFGLGTLLWGIALSVGLNLAGVLYYRQSGQEEAHRVARWLRDQGGTVVAYQLPRRQKDMGTGRPKLQETSLPSLAFYLGHPYVQAETIPDLIGATPAWIFTRPGRLTDLDRVRLIRQGYQIDRAPVTTDRADFEVYRLERRGLLAK